MNKQMKLGRLLSLLDSPMEPRPGRIWPSDWKSILGALVLGAVVWRCRSFWIAVPFHAFQMLAMDFFCTLRVRAGVDGIGLGAFFEALPW